jgi:inhibitor of KinA sporulation pathway (predicted exonuclease)
VTLIHDRIEGQVSGIHLNAALFDNIHTFSVLKKGTSEQLEFLEKHGRFCKPLQAVHEFYNFLCDQHSHHPAGSITINVAGKNFGTYDRPMLRRLPDWDKMIVMRQRLMDPCMLYWDPFKDNNLPNLDTCLSRAGYLHSVSHDALDDALDVVRVIRAKYAAD